MTKDFKLYHIKLKLEKLNINEIFSHETKLNIHNLYDCEQRVFVKRHKSDGDVYPFIRLYQNSPHIKLRDRIYSETFVLHEIHIYLSLIFD